MATIEVEKGTEWHVRRQLSNTLTDHDNRIAALEGGGGGGGAKPVGINASLRTENADTLVVGTYIDTIVPYDINLDTADSWVISSDDTCSVVVDVQRATVAAPTTFASIAASAKPTLSSDTYNTGTMTSWSTSLLQGERVRLIVESASGTARVEVMVPGVAA